MTAPSSGRTVEPRSGGHGRTVTGRWNRSMGWRRGETADGEIIFCITKPPSPSVVPLSLALPLARWFVGSFVSKWACTRFYQLCGPTSLARPTARSAVALREREGRKGHPRQKMPSSLLGRLSFSTFHPAYGRPRRRPPCLPALRSSTLASCSN